MEEQLELEAVALNEMMLNNLRQYADIRFSRLTAELRDKQKLQQLWKARRDAWRTLNIQQVRVAGGTHTIAQAPLTGAPFPMFLIRPA